jgi:hypothetical protein
MRHTGSSASWRVCTVYGLLWYGSVSASISPQNRTEDNMACSSAPGQEAHTKRLTSRAGACIGVLLKHIIYMDADVIAVNLNT